MIDMTRAADRSISELTYVPELCPIWLIDFYKLAHRQMYPEGTTLVYSTWTARSSRIEGCNEFVWVGLRPALRGIVEVFDTLFFNLPREVVVRQYQTVIKHCFGVDKADASHIESLHNYGYLPLRVRSLLEGSVVPIRTPVMTIQNTRDEFFWVTNYVESLLSAEAWGTCTAATIARQYRLMFDEFELETTGENVFAPFQGHDFSFRGMNGVDAAIKTGIGHLTSFVGTDTVPAIIAAVNGYCSGRWPSYLVGTSIPASEHSVQCAYGDDMEYFSRLINVVHPEGFVSIVADGYDFWDVLTRVLPALKDDIMSREGRVVIRPDSGCPVKIICGDPEGVSEAARKGAVQLLWETFGGAVSKQGYKMLDSHIGLIYGDSITLERAREILTRLRAAGFASTNVVFGIGSFTYQYQTRDTFGQALKSTLVRINGEEKMIFKDPKTDDGTKKSQRGRVVVLPGAEPNTYVWSDGHSLNEHVPGNLLTDEFEDGEWKRFVPDLATIRERIREHKPIGAALEKGLL